MAEFAGKKHTLTLDNRERLVITGAEDVNGFNEDTVSVKTTAGTLIVKGSALHIDRLDLETGDVALEGNVGIALVEQAVSVEFQSQVRVDGSDIQVFGAGCQPYCQ